MSSKNDGHSTSLFEKLSSFYKEEELSDTIILAGADCVKIHANRNILSAFSDYFLEKFREEVTSSDKTVFEFKKMQPAALKLVFDFIYSGCIELSFENSEHVLRIAAFLKIQTLVQGCCDIIVKNGICKNNCIKWLSLSTELNLRELKQKSLRYAYKHFDKISKEKELLLLNENDLKDLLFNDNPYGDFEEHVFLAMVAWVEYDKPQRQHLLFQLLSLVRYRYLSAKFIIKHRRSVCKTMESCELICSWLQWHLAPETRDIEEQKIDLKPREGDEKLAVFNWSNSDGILIETWNPAEDSWSIDRKIPLYKKETPYDMILIDERLFIVGGNIRNFLPIKRVDCLDLNAMKWNDATHHYFGCMSTFISLNGSLAHIVYHEKIYHHFHIGIYIYDFSTNKWNTFEHEYCSVPPLHGDTSRFLQINSKLYMVNLMNGILLCCDLHSKKWTQKFIIKEERYGFGFCGDGKYLYVIGGSNERSVLTNSFKRYDLSNDTWSELTTLPEARNWMKATIFGKKIVCFFHGENSVREYNPETDTWRSLSPLNNPFTVRNSFIFITCSVFLKNDV